MNAAPRPMNPRVTISMFGDDAKDAIAENVPNQIRPKLSAYLRPYRSPSEPAVRRRHANTMVYESTIHCRSEPEAPSFSTMVGSATFSTVLSIPMTTTHSDSTHSVHQRRDEAGSVIRACRSCTGDASTG